MGSCGQNVVRTPLMRDLGPHFLPTWAVVSLWSLSEPVKPRWKGSKISETDTSSRDSHMWSRSERTRRGRVSEEKKTRESDSDRKIQMDRESDVALSERIKYGVWLRFRLLQLLWTYMFSTKWWHFYEQSCGPQFAAIILLTEAKLYKH